MDKNTQRKLAMAILNGEFDRIDGLNNKLKHHISLMPEIYHSDAVLAYWSDLLMDIELGKDPDEVLELPHNIPDPFGDEIVTRQSYLRAYVLAPHARANKPTDEDFGI